MFKRLWNKRVGASANIQDLQLYAKFSDKYTIKSIIQHLDISGLYCAKLLGSYDKFEDISINCLPEQFVIKVNHWCGDVRIIHSKQEFMKKYTELKQYFNSILKKVYRNGLEPHYKYIKPKLFIEEHLGENIIDYKIHCVWGQPVVIMAMNVSQHKFYNYTIEWKKLNIQRGHTGTDNLPKPSNLSNLVEKAKILSKDFDYVRVDLYSINNKVYFGEYTFTPGGCGSPYFQPFTFDLLLDKFYREKSVQYDLLQPFL